MKQDELIEKSSGSVFGSLAFLPIFTKTINAYTFENPNVQKFIKSTGLHFDVIVAEEFYADSLLMLAFKHKAPIVTICKCYFSFQIENTSVKLLFLSK